MNTKLLNNRIIFLGLMACLLLSLALIYFIFKPEAQKHQNDLNQQNQMLSENKHTKNMVEENHHGKMPILAPSLQGTEIDCPIQVDAKGKLILTVGIRSCFDYFFSSLGEKTETELISDIRQYLTATLPETASSYASYLLDQYVAYTHALKNLKSTSDFKTGDVEGFQKLIDQMYKVQQQFFNSAEINALFGNERNLNQFNIDQMHVHANKALTAQQKASELATLIDQLPSTLADGVRVSMQFAELQQLTQEIQTKGGSAQELRNMRESLLGADAADRLEKVDQEEAGWQKQVNSYLSEREQILKGNSTDASKQQLIDQLRHSTFASKEDLLRAESYELMHDQKNGL